MKKFIYILLLFTTFLFINIASYANNVFSELSENIFRLHIIANSDNKEDQEIKLVIRDRIIDYLKDNCNSSSKKDTIEFCHSHIEELRQIADTVLEDNKLKYKSSVDIGNFYFPTKNYANISLPAGYYDALKIQLGNADGKNWWCSLFPPLCFVDISSGVLENKDSEILENTLSTEDFSLISGSSNEIKLKFKIVEIFNEKSKSVKSILAASDFLD